MMLTADGVVWAVRDLYVMAWGAWNVVLSRSESTLLKLICGQAVLLVSFWGVTFGISPFLIGMYRFGMSDRALRTVRSRVSAISPEKRP
jgi:hypothetical protein